MSGGTSRPPTQPPNPPSGKCGQKGRGLSDDPRIVGGQNANPGEWPWQVGLHRGSGTPFCGASLVSDQYVITAAHCVKAGDWSRLKVGCENIITLIIITLTYLPINYKN